jgi:hypothetical protein
MSGIGVNQVTPDGSPERPLGGGRGGAGRTSGGGAWRDAADRLAPNQEAEGAQDAAVQENNDGLMRGFPPYEPFFEAAELLIRADTQASICQGYCVAEPDRLISGWSGVAGEQPVRPPVGERRSE